MRILADALLLMVALIHAYIVVLEMVLWTTPRGRAAFGTTAEFARESRTLAANQGLYNGFLVAGLLVAVIAPHPTGYWFAIFFSGCVIIAGLYGGLTVSRRILVVQSLPAALALAAVIIAG